MKLDEQIPEPNISRIKTKAKKNDSEEITQQYGIGGITLKDSSDEEDGENEIVQILK